MKKKSTTQSARARRNLGEGGFFNLRVLIGLCIALAGICLALVGLDAFAANSAPVQVKNHIITASNDPLVPVGLDCSKIQELGIDKQENFRAGAIMIACGEGDVSGSSVGGFFQRIGQAVKELLAPLYGSGDVNLINHPETSPNIVQSETYTTVNPDNPQQIVVAYNDSRGRNANPINISGASVSTNGGATFDRLTKANGQSPFTNTTGDPVILYNKPTSTWFTVWIGDGACGGGLGGFKSTTPWDPLSWTHYPCVHSGASDDRESGYADNNPSSPFFGRMYVSWNNFAVGGGAIQVVRSTDNGVTWSAAVTVAPTFIRNVQITGDKVTGAVYIAGMDEMGGGLTNRANKLYRSTDGGATWTNTYTGPTFPGPGRSASGFFATMYASPAYWRHMGWGEPAAFNGVVSLVYASRNTGTGDPGDVFYIRSTDMGVTFSAPFQLNANVETTKAQWMPNLSVSEAGTLFATWYDEAPRTSASCQPSSPANLCYQMHSRKSPDNGVTWLDDQTTSDVVSPLPLQNDPGIQPTYAGDYDYGSAVTTKHVTSWVDGRNAINGASQQDAFTDRDLVRCPRANHYVISQIGGNIVPGTTDIGNHGDDTVTTIALPFPFTLYDRTFNSVNLSSNGNAQFTTTDTTFTNQCLPWTTHNYTIYPYWNDLYLVNSGFGLFTSISGSAPNRIFNIEWRAQYFPVSGTANFELRLYEGQRRFDIIYGTLTNGNTSATAGVQRDNTTFTQYFCNGSGSMATGGQGYVLSASPTYDFDHNGKPDYVLYNGGTHQTAVWYMNNNVFAGGVFGPTLPGVWRVVGVADFDGDGNLDYLLFNPGTHQTAIWYLSGVTLVGGAFGPTLPSAWAPVAVGDFNGDCNPDYVLYNASTRRTAIWYMNNNVLTSGVFGPTLPAGWIIAGVADFDRDGLLDYLLFNASTRQSAIWYLSGTTFVGGAFGPTLPSAWALLGAGDFNGDGSPDYVLYNASTRQTAIWYLNNNVLTSGAFGPTLPGAWNLVAP